METKPIVSGLKSIAEALPDGVHAPEGVAFLAKMPVSQLPNVVCFGEPYFSEPTAFMKTSDKRRYYMTTMSECSCPDFRFRKAGTGELCKHQKELARRLERKARIDARNKERAIQRAQREPIDFNQKADFSMSEAA
jgi:hypothetical protein